MIRGLLIILIVSHVATLHAQDCAQQLEEATRAYYQGDLREVKTIIGDCINDGLIGETRAQALQLLINAHLLLNDNSTADTYMFEFLKLKPNYKPGTADLAEFTSLLQTFQTRPRYSFGLIGGVLFSDYQITRHQSLSARTIEPNDYNEKNGVFSGCFRAIPVGQELLP